MLRRRSNAGGRLRLKYEISREITSGLAPGTKPRLPRVILFFALLNVNRVSIFFYFIFQPVYELFGFVLFEFAAVECVEILFINHMYIHALVLN